MTRHTALVFLLACDPKTEDTAPKADCSTSWFEDLDGDGFGARALGRSCDPPASGVATDGDCDDADASVHPGAPETCNGLDNNCSGGEDDATDLGTFYEDADGDGYGDADREAYACEAPTGYVTDHTDCDDTDAAISPDAVETCDGKIDEDCDGLVDDEDDPVVGQIRSYLDWDEDGYGSPAKPLDACVVPADHVENALDCNDWNAGVYPGAPETCNGLDNNCSGDEDDATDPDTFYEDADGDGYGDADREGYACEAPTGYVADHTDCDDTNAAISPGAVETCDGKIDEDCDGLIDDEDTYARGGVWVYVDADGDGYGDDSLPRSDFCVVPSGYSTAGGDCDDSDPSISAISEVCGCDDGIDNDSDGLIDCEDGECASYSTCYESDCSDQFDNDDDGRPDCLDDDCWGESSCDGIYTMAWISGGNVRKEWYYVYRSTSRFSGDRVWSTGKREWGQVSASSITGSALLVSVGAASSVYCDWAVNAIQWGTTYHNTTHFDGGGTDFHYGEGHSVERSGFALSSGCPLSVSSEALLPRIVGAGGRQLFGNPLFWTGMVLYRGGYTFYGASWSRTSPNSTTRYTIGTGYTGWRNRFIESSYATGQLTRARSFWGTDRSFWIPP